MTICVGDVGRAISRLSPSGAVEVNGRRLDARSDGRVIEPGSTVVVLRGDPSGYVVRELEPGQPPPEVPGHGRPIRKAEFQRTAAEVAEADRRDRADARQRLLRAMRYGSAAAGALGVATGLVSGGAGWYFGRAGVNDPAGIAVLLGGHAAAGAVAGVALFFLTGLVGSVLGVFGGNADFAPDFAAIFVALVGAAVGFWWQFPTGDATTIAAWSAGGAFLFAVAALALGWLGSRVLEPPAGE
jgi:hypothetical protein